MSQQFVARQWVRFPVEQVFAFFANPINLPRLMPKELKTRIEELGIVPDSSGGVAAGVGSEILIGFCPIPWLPLRIRWLARITAFERNSYFADEQVRGPFAYFRHRHGIEAETCEGHDGTLVSDEIEFALPYGWAGRMFEGAVRRQLSSSFAFRQRRLEEILKAECVAIE